MSKTIYGRFSEGLRDKVKSIFDDLSWDELNKYQILCIIEEEDSYSGEVTVIYHDGEKIMGVFSSHCSCDGHKWEPEEVTLDQLKQIFNSETNDVKDKLFDSIGINIYKEKAEDPTEKRINDLEMLVGNLHLRVNELEDKK